MTKVRMDPTDRLPAIEAQAWASEKHQYLRQYIDISRAARRKFLSHSGATYIELFCGPGRLFDKHSGAFFDGSPLVAFEEAQRTGTPFTSLHLGDELEDSCDAVEARLRARGATAAGVRTHPLRSEAAAKRIVRELPKGALNFAFLDPFNLDLPFSIIELFAQLQSADLLLHVSAMDLQRNLPSAMKGEASSLDRFAPRWREAVGELRPGVEARGKIIEHWLTLVRGAGFKHGKVWRLIRGQNNQPLYWLVLVAKHPLATKFWDEVGKSKQNDLFNEG